MLMRYKTTLTKIYVIFAIRDINFLTPQSNQYLISPCSVTPELHIKGHEKTGNDHQLEKILIGKQTKIQW